jgi:hypothetical protein
MVGWVGGLVIKREGYQQFEMQASSLASGADLFLSSLSSSRYLPTPKDK